MCQPLQLQKLFDNNDSPKVKRDLKFRKVSHYQIIVNGRLRKVSTRDSVYSMKRKLVNIKYAHDDWHAIGKRALEIIGFFVFISKNADVFYIIPSSEMKKYASVTPINSYDSRKEFHIYPSSHTYYAPTVKFDVYRFFKGWLQPTVSKESSSNVISYQEVRNRQRGRRLQQRMNYRLSDQHSIFLMNTSSDAPYGDKIGTDGILIYEGHDIPKNKRGLDPKKTDQPTINKNGKPTRNGLFYNLTLAYKLGNSKPEVIKVYQKLAKNRWVDREFLL
jgi:hypothetical protein